MNFRGLVGAFLFIIVAVIVYTGYRENQRNKKISPPSTSDEYEKKGILVEGKEFHNRLICPHCKGTGKFTSREGRIQNCGICKGAGAKMMPQLRNNQTLCPNCSGFGKTVVFDKKTNAIIGYEPCRECRRGIQNK